MIRNEELLDAEREVSPSDDNDNDNEGDTDAAHKHRAKRLALLHKRNAEAQGMLQYAEGSDPREGLFLSWSQYLAASRVQVWF